MSLHFEFPANLSADQFIAHTAIKQADAQLVSQHYSIRTYYDSFDWRLYSSGITCELNRSKSASYLTLTNLKTGLVIASTELDEVPKFSKQFVPGAVRSTLEPILEMRALLPVCTLNYESYHLNIVNKDEKIVLRVLIEEHELLNNRLVLQPVKGYDKAAKHIAEILTTKLGLMPTDKPVLLAALRLQGRRPLEYSSKLNINLDPTLRADIATKYIYSHLLKAIKDNEQGTIDDTDSEFLHDFRVAVRRTRSGLSQIKSVLPDDICAPYAEFFSWLGQITGPARDLDVYLLNFDHYKSSLPASIREDLNPLHDFLLAKKNKAHKELATKLQSTQYKTTLSEWEQYLKKPSFKKPIEQNAHLTIKELADKRIWKVFNRALHEGNAINRESPAEALHTLRKTCKKLRYLMEFFQSLYPEHQIKHLIKHLKGLQEVLGDFQDYAVQEQNLKLFSEEMMTLNIPSNTFLAMGVLIQNLDSRRWSARKDFASRFEDFKQEENQSAFKSLFDTKD